MEFKFKGLPALFKAFPDDQSARHYLEAKRWDGCPKCPFCGSEKYYKRSDGIKYRCGAKECRKDYTVTTGTFFHSSKIDLHIWFGAMYLMSAHKKGISSHQLAKDLDITQKSAWFMLHRLRGIVAPKKPQKLMGIIEADETYMSRKFRTDMSHMSEEEREWRLKAKNTSSNKGMAFGMIARNGNIVVKAFDKNGSENVKNAIKNTVEKHSWLITDGAFMYRQGLEDYKHESVIHSKREYVKGDIHTNNVENFWGIMKRGIYGIYHQVSFKHLQRYCDEFTFRYNNRKIMDNTRFELSLEQPEGRLTYQQLIADVKPQKEIYIKEENEWE